MGDNQLTCPVCGSNAVTVQVIQEQQGSKTVTRTKAKYKQKKHGFLWWLLIGWWWWFFDLLLWVFLFPFRFAAGLLRKKKYKKTETSVSVQKNKIAYKKFCTCQNCGHVWQTSV